MKQVQKILFPIDFAANFETLVPWVSTLAKKFDATVYVLFVAQDLKHFASFYVPHGNIEDFQKQSIDSAKKRMAAAAQEFSPHFPKLETRVEQPRRTPEDKQHICKEKAVSRAVGASDHVPDQSHGNHHHGADHRRIVAGEGDIDPEQE